MNQNTVGTAPSSTEQVQYLCVRSPEEIAKQIQMVTREDIQITLSSVDCFSEEINVFVYNTGAISHNPTLVMPVASFTQGPQASIKILNSSNHEIASSLLYGNVISATANSLFYALYTTKS